MKLLRNGWKKNPWKARRSSNPKGEQNWLSSSYRCINFGQQTNGKKISLKIMIKSLNSSRISVKKIGFSIVNFDNFIEFGYLSSKVIRDWPLIWMIFWELTAPMEFKEVMQLSDFFVTTTIFLHAKLLYHRDVLVFF
jgi:hypothetical protein